MYQFKVGKMHCMSCVRNIEDYIKDHDDNADIKANLTDKTVSIKTNLSVEKVKAIIQEAGYEAIKIS